MERKERRTKSTWETVSTRRLHRTIQFEWREFCSPLSTTIRIDKFISSVPFLYHTMWLQITFYRWTRCPWLFTNSLITRDDVAAAAARHCNIVDGHHSFLIHHPIHGLWVWYWTPDIPPPRDLSLSHKSPSHNNGQSLFINHSAMHLLYTANLSLNRQFPWRVVTVVQ